MADPVNGDAPLSTADLAGAAPRAEPPAQQSAAAPDPPAQASATPLLPESEVTDLRGKWDTIQTGFVDEPRRAVENADALVATAMKRLAEVFAAERAELEGQWDRGDDVSTEDLRLALQRYRTFFGRLLSI